MREFDDLLLVTGGPKSFKSHVDLKPPSTSDHHNKTELYETPTTDIDLDALLRDLERASSKAAKAVKKP